MRLGRPRILEALFKHNIHLYLSASFTSPATQQTSPMHCAVHYGQAECLKILVENGFDPNLQTASDMTTPVHVAIRTGAGIGHTDPNALERCMKTLHTLL